VRFAIAITLQVLLLAALNFFDDWTLPEMPVRFVVCAMLCGTMFLWACSNFPARHQVITFWSVAVLLRLVALPMEPSDDFWRYQWEGRIQHAGFNPYVLAPDAPELQPVREEFAHFHKINHRDHRAIYPPGAQLLFSSLARATESPLLPKLVFTAADLATAGVLLLLIGGSGRFAAAAWYAWNPLVVYSFAGSAHFDSLMVLPMVAAVYLLTRRPVVAAALLGVAISIKLIPLLLLPLFALALRLRAGVLLLSVAIPAALSLLYGWPRVPIWDSLGDFAHVTRLNDLFWWIVEETVWPNPRQKNYRYNVIIVAAVVLVSLFFWRNWRRGVLWVLGTATILTPVLHPWYLTWLLPFATCRRAIPWQVLSVSLFAYFLFWNERLFLIPWRSELWLRLIIIAPPLIALLLWSRRSPAAAPAPP
jgi:alpha-1,6-mannosyltransferase